MKIEMGESLFYSWLRHTKECQVVQLNWKTSPEWSLNHEEELEMIMKTTAEYFEEYYGITIYKKTSSLAQLLQQAECDAVGITNPGENSEIYFIDVAFHKDGLMYGDKNGTVATIIKKCIRAAMCIYGYFDSKTAEIIFASPKVYQSTLKALLPCVQDMQQLMDSLGFHYKFRIIANEQFDEQVLKPILLISDGVADTAELFLRSYQMIQLFSADFPQDKKKQVKVIPSDRNYDAYDELRIGKVVQILVRDIFNKRAFSDDELKLFQEKDYCKKVFHLNYPLLVALESDYDKNRYYKDPIEINGDHYKICSQWKDSSRPCLMAWIKAHDQQA